MGFFDKIGSAVGSVLQPVTGMVGGLANDVLGGVLGTGGGGNLLGDALTGGAISNNAAIRDINAQNIMYSQKQNEFQERLSNTAYQRAMADMKTAGLNPMLAFSQGGASVPTGSVPSLTSPRPGDVGAGLMSSAKSIASLSANLANTSADTDLKSTSANLNKANTDVADVQAKKITANAKESEANTALVNQQMKKARYDTERSKAEAKVSKMESEVKESRQPIDKDLAPFDAFGERIGGLLRGVMGIFNSAKSTGRPSGSGTFNGRYVPRPKGGKPFAFD